MTPLQPKLIERDPLSFVRLFVALGLGVGAVTLVLALAAAVPVLAMALGGALTLGAAVLVMFEVNRLLADEEPSA
jgi:hypothetical protein